MASSTASGPLHVVMIVEAAGGGMGRHVRDLSLGLCEAGVQVTVIYSPVRRDHSFRAFLEALHVRGQRSYPVPMRRSIARPWRDVSAIVEIRRVVRQLVVRADLIHGHSSKGGALARLAARTLGMPAVYTPNAFAFASPDTPLSQRALFGGIEWLLARSTSLLIAVSDAESELAARYRLRPRLVRTVYNGIDVSPFLLDRRARDRTGPLRVVSLARVTEQKDPQFWQEIALAARGRPIRFRWVGPHVPNGPLNLALAELGESAEFVGAVTEDAVPAVLREADVFLMTSRYEGLSYALIEAMASGLPAVCRACPGVSEIVEHGVTGYLIQSGDPRDFVHALEELRASPDLAARMGQAARERVEARYRVDRMVGETLAAYRECLTAAEPAGR